MNPYEFYNETLGVQARFLVKGRDAHEASLELLSDRAFRDRVQTETIKLLRKPAKNNPLLVRYDSLPPSWQRLLAECFCEPPTMTRRMLFEKFYERDTKALAFFTTYKLNDGKYLPDEVVEEYTINASVLNTIDIVYGKRYAMRKVLRGGVVDIWETLAREAQQFKKIKEHTLPDNYRRLREKVNLYKKNGYTELIHRNFSNKYAEKVNSDVLSLLNNMFSGQSDKPTATEIYRQYEAFLNGELEVINDATGEIYDYQTYPEIGESTVRNYLAKWVNKIATHAKRSGDRQKFMGLFRPYHSLEQPKYAGSLISIDDRNPPFAYVKGKRVWFYNAIDLGSEAFTCWVYGKTKDGIIVEFYRQLVRNYTMWGLNMPDGIECESSLNSSFKNTFLREGAMFENVRIEANNARGKRIEAYYRPLRYNVEKKRVGWLARPNALSESNQAGSAEVPMIPFNEIVVGCLKDIETWNNMPHSKITNKTRWEVFMETQNPNVKPTNWRAILPTLGYCTGTSCRTGIVKLQNCEFLLGDGGNIYFGEKLINLLDQIEGKDIDVYWLDDNKGAVLKALVYLRNDDRFICELYPKPSYSRAVIERTPEDLERREVMSKYVATIDGFMNRQRKALDTVTVIDNRKLTLNNKFSMASMMPGVDSLKHHDDTNDFENVESEEVQSLEMPEPEELIFIETSFKRSLKDRF